MTVRELHRLRREDLLQILLSQQKQIEELSAELEKKDRSLRDRAIAIRESGSIAEAALRLNDVFTKAQDAADQYLEQAQIDAEVRRRESDAVLEAARRTAEEILQKARSQAGSLVKEADAIKAQAEAALREAEASLAKATEPPRVEKRRFLFGRRGG